MSLEELFNDSSEFFDEAQCKVTIVKGGCIEWHSGEDLGDDELADPIEMTLDLQFDPTLKEMISLMTNGDDEQDIDPLLRCDNLESYEGIKP